MLTLIHFQVKECQIKLEKPALGYLSIHVYFIIKAVHIFIFYSLQDIIKEMPIIKIQVTLRSRTLPWLLYPPVFFHIIFSVKASLEASIGIKITLKRNFDSMKTFCLHFWIKLIRLKAEFKLLWIREKIIKSLNL